MTPRHLAPPLTRLHCRWNSHKPVTTMTMTDGRTIAWCECEEHTYMVGGQGQPTSMTVGGVRVGGY